jgi:hypothetical protein
LPFYLDQIQELQNYTQAQFKIVYLYENMNSLKEIDNKILLEIVRLRLFDDIVRFNETFNEEVTYNDRFTLKFPYCAKYIQCMYLVAHLCQLIGASGEVIFDAHQPSVPPDFILEESQEQIVDLSLLKTIPKWASTNKSALLDIVLELIGLFKVNSNCIGDSNLYLGTPTQASS